MSYYDCGINLNNNITINIIIVDCNLELWSCHSKRQRIGLRFIAKSNNLGIRFLLRLESSVVNTITIRLVIM